MSTDNRTAMTWKDGKWMPVPVEQLKECRPGKPEDCPRCNALTYLDLTRRHEAPKGSRNVN